MKWNERKGHEWMTQTMKCSKGMTWMRWTSWMNEHMKWNEMKEMNEWMKERKKDWMNEWMKWNQIKINEVK